MAWGPEIDLGPAGKVKVFENGEPVEVMPGVWERLGDFAEGVQEAGKFWLNSLMKPAIDSPIGGAAEMGLQVGTGFAAAVPGAVQGATWAAMAPAGQRGEAYVAGFGEAADKYTYRPKGETGKGYEEALMNLYMEKVQEGYGDQYLGQLVDEGRISPEMAAYFRTSADALIMGVGMRAAPWARAAGGKAADAYWATRPKAPGPAVSGEYIPGPKSQSRTLAIAQGTSQRGGPKPPVPDKPAAPETNALIPRGDLGELAIATSQRGGRVVIPPPRVAEADQFMPIESRLDAEQRWSAGEEIYAFHEMGGEPTRITSKEMLDAFTYDQLAVRSRPSNNALVERRNLAIGPGRKQRGGAAFHGTPHKFDMFDLQKIGTGEGAQAYGHGLYFAESPGVAKSYQTKLSTFDPYGAKRPKIATVDGVPAKDLGQDVWEVADQIAVGGHGDVDTLISHLRGKLKATNNPSRSPVFEDLLTQAEEVAPKIRGKKIAFEGGHLYEVDIPDETIAKMLDWDAPLSEQPESVRKALEGSPFWDDIKGRVDVFGDSGGRGESIYELIGTKLGSEEAASRALNEAGIPGIRYYDAQSRVTGRPRKAIIKSFLDELPEDAEFDDLAELVGTGHFTKEQDAVLRALEKDDWLGFDYPSQAINEAFGPNLKNWEPSAELTKAIKDVVEPDATRNIVVFNPDDIKSVKRDGELVYQAKPLGQVGPGAKQRGGPKQTNALRSTIVESGRPVPTVPNSLLTVRPEVATARARKKAKRVGLPAEKQPGKRVNPRTVLKAKGQPDFVVGELTFDDWVARVKAILSPAEIKAARKWYKEIHDIFAPFFGQATDQIVAAFLIANKNVTPEGALHNALRAREQLLTGNYGKLAGLNHNALISLFKGEPIKSGVGQKLFDFVDSEAGKSTRSIFGDDPIGGEPVVIDVHSARDAGYVDVPLLNALKAKGYDVSGIKSDFKYNAKNNSSSAPQETQYEVASDWMRELTQDLNRRRFMRGQWVGSEAQAVGWVAMSKFTGGAPSDDSLAAITGNIRRVSFELAPGVGSPARKKYGDRFAALPKAKQRSITTKVLKGVSTWVADKLAIASFDMVAGTGGWMRATNPSLVTQVLSSKETSELAANIIGFLAQQQQVWVNKLKPMTANPKAFGITVVGKHMGKTAAINKVWAQILKKDKTGLVQGYQPIVNENGVPGILILIDSESDAWKGAKRTMAAIENEIRIMFDEIASAMKHDIITQASEAEIYKAGSKVKYDGKEYLERIQQAGRKDLIPELRNYRSELEKKFGDELDRAEGSSKRSGR